MKTTVPSSLPQPSEMEIQHAAYLLWIESGKAPGHDLDNWLAAKELLRHHHGRATGVRGDRRATRPLRPVLVPQSN